jgi:2-amino-4-hydroxy-6-hydroxymethyldihydropteridine diphosphokinase
LGSNLGDREETLLQAWREVGRRCTFSRLSRIYETLPRYVEDQPRYLNAVGEAWCDLSPPRMLFELQRIEARYGRDRSREVRWGPRILDLDILLCAERILQLPDLQVPHPRMQERLFVLVPLLELDPDLRDPRTGLRFAEVRRALEEAEGGSPGVYLHPGPGYTDPSKPA